MVSLTNSHNDERAAGTNRDALFLHSKSIGQIDAYHIQVPGV